MYIYSIFCYGVPACPNVNRAVGKPTWQSSTRQQKISDIAVDGDRNPMECTHTAGNGQHAQGVHAVYPIKYAHSFAAPCFILLLFFFHFGEFFTNIRHDYFIDTESVYRPIEITMTKSIILLWWWDDFFYNKQYDNMPM